jgi:oligopeptide/dipeptide ABC transporter ATP-binding protein
VPPLDGPRTRLKTIPGGVARPGEAAPGCPFRPRCEHAAAVCAKALPPLCDVAAGHRAACVRLEPALA